MSKVSAETTRSPWRCSHLRGGDHGQRYEVRYKDGMGSERVFGWAGTEEGAQLMATAINKHPTWNSPRIVDRHVGNGCA